LPVRAFECRRFGLGMKSSFLLWLVVLS